MTLVSRKDLVDWFVGYEDILQLPEQPTGSPWLFDTADAARFQPLINNISSLYARIYERYKQACKRSGLEVDHSVFGFGYFDENSTKPIRFGSVYSWEAMRSYGQLIPATHGLPGSSAIPIPTLRRW